MKANSWLLLLGENRLRQSGPGSRFGSLLVALEAAAGAVLLAISPAPLEAGFYDGTISPGSVPWPGGVVPYVLDPALSAAQQQTYLDGLREWELAANVQFVPRTTETQYVLFKYDPGGPNLVSGSNPQVVEINLLTRAQICHEMGHSFGLLHEHTRADRDGFVDVLLGNVIPGEEFWFDKDFSGTVHGAYDFESVMHFPRDLFSTSPGTLDTLEAKPGFEKFQPRMGGYALSAGDRAVMEYLYGPPSPVLSPIVTTTSEGGPGSLRAAMYYAADNPGTTITFNIPGSDPGFANGVFTIRLTGHLPPMVTDGTTIDGTSQPGFAGKPLIFIDGSQILPESGSVPGLFLFESNCAVKGLAFANMPWVGVALLYPECAGNVISGCWSGVDHTGAAAAPNQLQGIQVAEGANGNTIGGPGAGQGNVLSGNTEYGLYLEGAATTGNVIAGNYIGTDCAGGAALPNHLGGMILTGGAGGNTVGGTAPGTGNILSGNANAGVWITGAGADGNMILGNLIGLDAGGFAAVPNSFAGIFVLSGAADNLISGNVISGNSVEGCRLAGPGTSGNVFTRNFVGTDAAGGAAVSNGFAGLTIFDGAAGNTIGGSALGEGNVISGNTSYGVVIADPGSNANTVRGNIVGLRPDGMALPNGFAGVALWNGAQGNEVGGAMGGAGNIIAANATYGIALFDAATTFGNTFLGNSIYGHGGSGISLGGANHAQSAPVLSAASLSAAGTAVSGSLASTASRTFRIEFFSSDGPGGGEGKTFLGALDGLMTDGAGMAAFSPVLPAMVSAGRVITATATDTSSGDTSEFSNATPVTSADMDSDGMPDDYEMANGLDKNVDDAAGDKDGDGLTNREEFHAGTDPQDANDVLRATSIERSGAQTVIKFASVPGKIYRVEKSTDLGPGSWRAVIIFVVATGPEIEVIDAGASQEQRAYYRAIAVS